MYLFLVQRFVTTLTPLLRETLNFTDSEFVVPTMLELPELSAHLCYLGTYQGVCPAARDRLSLLFFPWPVIHQEQVQPCPPCAANTAFNEVE